MMEACFSITQDASTVTGAFGAVRRPCGHLAALLFTVRPALSPLRVF